MEKTRELTRRALQVWADVTPLTFTEVCKSCKSDLAIDFARHIHDDEGPEDVSFIQTLKFTKVSFENLFLLRLLMAKVLLKITCLIIFTQII